MYCLLQTYVIGLILYAESNLKAEKVQNPIVKFHQQDFLLCSNSTLPFPRISLPLLATSSVFHHSPRSYAPYMLTIRLSPFTYLVIFQPPTRNVNYPLALYLHRLLNLSKAHQPSSFNTRYMLWLQHVCKVVGWAHRKARAIENHTPLLPPTHVHSVTTSCLATV